MQSSAGKTWTPAVMRVLLFHLVDTKNLLQTNYILNTVTSFLYNKPRPPPTSQWLDLQQNSLERAQRTQQRTGVHLGPKWFIDNIPAADTLDTQMFFWLLRAALKEQEGLAYHDVTLDQCTVCSIDLAKGGLTNPQINFELELFWTSYESTLDQLNQGCAHSRWTETTTTITIIIITILKKGPTRGLWRWKQ